MIYQENEILLINTGFKNTVTTCVTQPLTIGGLLNKEGNMGVPDRSQ